MADKIRLELLNNYGNDKLLATDNAGDLAFLTLNNISPFKIWAGYISQTGTSAPTLDSVIINTVGGTLVWSYVSTGVYRATLSGAFPSGKLFAPLQVISPSGTTHRRLQITRINDNVIELTANEGASPTNALLSTSPVWFLIAR